MSTVALGKNSSGMGMLLRHMDVALACGVIGVIFVLVIPLPTMILDALLCCQLALSLAILLGAIYSQEPLEFSGFPPLLLLVTLFRLALNVASSRLILLNGDAGHVISSFGQFVVGGNYVVGFTIFLILIIIQFVVITKGAGRVAEVAARFTLDAMPGKQMAIDADLNAGLIDEAGARVRRSKIEREANFYGAMDGASKFVRGDAIAALIITAVNLLGGLAIGCLQRGLDPANALKQFALLSIGDGLVTQIPALLISTASGILVTRGASESSLGEDFGRQLFTHAKSLRITAVFLSVFAFVPGLPSLPLLALGAAAFLMSNMVKKNEQVQATAAATAATNKSAPGAKPAPTPQDNAIQLDILELELGPSLLQMVDNAGGDLLGRIGQIRKKLATELGIVVPSVRVRDNLQLPSRHYRLKVRGAVVAEHELHHDKLLAINSGNARPGLEGTKTSDPAFGLPALWIAPSQRARGEAYGYTVVEPSSVLSTHLQELLRSSAADLLTRTDVQKLLDRLKESEPALVKDLVPNAVSIATLHRVLQSLLRERIPIRDITSVLEVLGDHAGSPKTVDALVEHVREALSPSFVGNLLDERNKLAAIACEPALESRLIQSMVQSDRGPMLVLMPNHVNALIKRVSDELANAQKRKLKPVMLCSAGLRTQLRNLLDRAAPTMPILSYNEIPRRATLEIVGQIPLAILGNDLPEIQARKLEPAAATK